MKIAVVYWSGTGNTEKMAEAVKAGAVGAGAEAELFLVSDVNVDQVAGMDGIALGSPAMGSEVIEEDEMEPFVEALLQKDLSGKPIVLFGSYDWGDGEWMRDWEQRVKSAGGNLIAEGLIIYNEPDEDGLAKSNALGQLLASQ